MHRSRNIVIIGAVIALLPFLGFPRAWEAFFQVAAGLSIVGLSVWAQIDRKLSLKAKAQLRMARRAAVEPGEDDSQQAAEEPPKVPEPTPYFGKRHTDFYPKTGQPGRRLSDIKLPNPDQGESAN